ncbi:hypothetical protein AJ79_07619 [Helicocarpus griseus UAMH5409]|uniref:Uncharacterized protein n=1 Tax=Helicocarpus griseus UAMH5409 TaxID=1447875 RepID=A0A2B7X0C5_9EURO|nr:hypothetical protein AJ79_07619 [Helicocarpus griseus UAMH5409]
MSTNPNASYHPVQDREYFGEGSRNTADDGPSPKVSLDGATIGGEDRLPSTTRKKRLRRRATAFWLVVFYVLIAVYSWIVLVALSRRPVSGKLRGKTKGLHASAKFLSGVAGVLAFPVATAVCARAVVPYVQKKREGLTLRQTMFLADRSWKSFGNWSTSTISKNHSFAIFPLQQILVGEEVAKIPGLDGQVRATVDFQDLFEENRVASSLISNDLRVQQLRYAITSTDLGEVDPYMWFDTSDCAQYELSSDTPRRCQGVSDYRYLGEDCADLPGSFHAEYSGTLDNQLQYSLQACMPFNQTNSPWKNQFRTPQDISEVLYLNITVNEDKRIGFPSYNPTVFRIQVDSKSGYFELPNYYNNGTASDIFPRDPSEFCDQHCPSHGHIRNNKKSPKSKRWTNEFTERPSPKLRETKYRMDYDNSNMYDRADNLGPLSIVAEALFGNSSFIATHSHSPLRSDETERVSSSSSSCRELAPLVRLTSGRNEANNFDISQLRIDCIRPTNGRYVLDQVQKWLGAFWANDTYPDSKIYSLSSDKPEKFQMERTLTAAIYLAHKGWMLDGTDSMAYTGLNFDMGIDAPLPVISFAGIIVISVLLGIFVFSLLGLAFYVSSTPTWTDTLNAFVMLRVGAALSADDSAGSLPPLSAHSGRTDVLDRKAGWFGDGRPEENAGEVELGAVRG